MTHPRASDAQIAFFREHGWLVVEDAVSAAELAEVDARCHVILEKKEKLAFDWAWEKGRTLEQREFKIVQGMPSLVWPEVSEAAFRVWALAFGSSLLGREVEFWYDMYLAKPPHDGAATPWHQDEGYWGRNLDERGITCWMPLHDVGVRNGCMHFIDGGHRDGVLEHRKHPRMQSDLLFCEPDEARAVPCPLRAGSVTFHHGKTPHMTPPNQSDGWRKAVTTHMRVVGSPGEGDHYPWKVYVNQVTGERTVPPSR
jgi:ectoine hydroxylase-related dioxygenase (phytanoyl-CoA dioxygenase family)